MAQLDKIKLSGTTYDIVDSTALHSLDDNVTSGGTNAVKGSGIYNAITAATGALAETIAEQGYQTSGDVQNAISGKVDTSAFTAHTADTVAHTTQAEKNAWDAKLDANAVSGYADSVKYNSTSKYVEFYHGGTGGTKVFEYDASPFLIDGMVQNVEIKDVELSGETVTCLVITFNTDAGKQDINIPISEIFDASNYYTKTEVDSMTKVSKTCWEEVEFTTGQGETIISEGVENAKFSYSSSTNVFWNIYADAKYSDMLGMVGGAPGNLTISYGNDLSIVSQGNDYVVFSATRPIVLIATSAITKVEVAGTCSENINTALEEFSASTNSALANKADTSAVTAVNDVLTAHTANTDIHVTTTDKSTWSGKQDALVSGTNIKTINNQSVLGSGNIDVQTLPTVSGTTLIFS